MADKYLEKPWSANQTFMAKSNNLNIVVPETATSLFLYNVNTKEQLNIKLIPDQLLESYNQRIISETPFGVLHPINFYSGGDSKKLNFSFDINEDMIISMNLAKTSYEFIEKLKSMSEPVIYNTNVYGEPLVYFQLGKQFAGKGHISTGISFKKPFRNGRYTLISCSIDFTFHEVFESDTINILSSDNTNTSYTSKYSLTLEDTTAGGISIDNFYTQNLDSEYIVTTIFNNEKITTFFNTYINSTNVASANIGSFEDFKTAILSNNQDILLSAVAFNPINPFFDDLLRLLFDSVAVISTIKFYSSINNAKILLSNIEDLKNRYNTSYKPVPGGYSYDSGIGWYQTFDINNRSVWVQLTEEEQDIFESIISTLENTIKSQILFYEALRGAGI